MSLVPSLLQAIVQVDGEALVMHAGDKPYVVAPTGQVELASRGLTLEAVAAIVAELLPTAFQRALDEFGAVQYELPAQAEFPDEHFTVVAARGGDDVWAEIRRRRAPDIDRIPEQLFSQQATSPADDQLQYVEDEQIVLDDLRASMPAEVGPDSDLSLPDESELWPGSPFTHIEAVIDDDLSLTPATTEEPPAAVRRTQPLPIPATAPGLEAPTLRDVLTPHEMPTVREAPIMRDVLTSREMPIIGDAPSRRDMPTAREAPIAPQAPAVRQVPVTPVAAAPVTPVAAAAPTPAGSPAKPARPVPSTPPQPAIVLQMSRSPIRAEASPPPRVDDTLSGLERLLRIASARGASTLYLSSDERPSVRVDGEVQMIDGEPVLSSNDVVSLLLTLMPERSHEALRTGVTTEWICDIADVGRVRCMSFGDHRGPGGAFRLMPVRAASAEQLGLSREIQALAIEPEGLVLVAGPRSSGKRTLIAALVDLINRTRRDHLITIEREVSIVHARGSSFISQREVRGNDDDMLAAARAALREDPDVLVLEQIRNGALMNVALEAAASGHLVIAGFSAQSATGAIDRIIDLYAPEYSRQVQLALADNLRGVIAQVLLKKIGGGRVAVREVLLNTPAVGSVIAEGKTSQLPMAIEGGRRHGMVPLTDSLVSLMQAGVIDAREAYRRVADRAAFLALLKRHGLDTSFVERLA